MKKILLLVLAVVLGLSLSFTVFADPGAFQNSPSTLQGPELIDANNDHHDCIARLIITSYADRHTLTDEKRVDLRRQRFGEESLSGKYPRKHLLCHPF